MRSLFVCLFLLIAASSQAQQKYWVFLKDKTDTVFDPYSYFDRKAIDRRIRNNVSLYDLTDLPVSQIYIDKIKRIVDSTTAVTRWFNAVVVIADHEQIQAISNLEFVVKISEGGTLGKRISGADDDLSAKSVKLLDYQTRVLGREDLAVRSLNGKGVRIAVLDAGFSDADKNPAFDHLRSNNRILKTYDFIKRRDHVYDHADHGTMVLSCIGGIYKGKNVGLATEAEFLLARTEFNLREPFSEEEHWVEAAEWADKNGADIINSSLGYTTHRYFQSDLDGKTSIVSRAATMAARKGILVVNAAGNEGTEDWKKLGVPADADSILSVGGIDPYLGMHVDFSSYGPTADGRMKPNVCAPGIVMAAVGERIGRTEGTSFSSPLMAGFAACVLQLHPEWDCQTLLHSIERSGRLYPYYDYAHGYGVPRAGYFLNDSLPEKVTFSFELINGNINVMPDSLHMENDDSDLLYYHIREQSGAIRKYYVLQLTSSEPVRLDVSAYSKMIVAIHFKGFTTEILLP